MTEHTPSDAGRPEVPVEAQRRDARDSLMVMARLRAEGSAEEPVSVRVRNVSSGGLMAQVSGSFGTGMRVEVDLDGIGLVKGAVAWAEAGRIGIAFDYPIDKSLARKSRPAGAAEESLLRPYTDPRRPSLRTR